MYPQFFLRKKLIPFSPNGSKMFWIGRVFLDFITKSFNVYQNSIVIWCITLPYLGKDFLLTEQEFFVFNKETEQGKFLGR